MGTCWVVDAWESNVKSSAVTNCLKKGMALPQENRQATAGEQVTEADKGEEEEMETDLENKQTTRERAGKSDNGTY